MVTLFKNLLAFLFCLVMFCTIITFGYDDKVVRTPSRINFSMENEVGNETSTTIKLQKAEKKVQSKIKFYEKLQKSVVLGKEFHIQGFQGTSCSWS